MVVTNTITFMSYFTICLTLFVLVRRTRRVIARDWAWFVVGFALFIVACGSTHLLDVITTWTPVFWVDAWTNIVTAVLSALVAIMLIRRVVPIGFAINDYAARLANTESDLARVQESLLSAQKLEEWSRMSAVVSHEIGNPLEAIQNLLYLIRSSAGVTPEIDGLSRQAADEADRVLAISRSTLAFFRQTTEPEVIDISEAAQSLHFLLSSVMANRNTQLDLHTEGDLTVEALPGEFRQVLLNLVRNACEASSRPDSHVRLSFTGKPSAVDIVVADEGTGIDPSILPSLFQFGASTKGEHGNGMGLWTVKHIVTRHGGEIKVASTPGAGTTFTVTWPRKFPDDKVSSRE
jgi:signal transduction histidine kinase